MFNINLNKLNKSAQKGIKGKFVDYFEDKLSKILYKNTLGLI
jgi:hypothetical protein